MPKVYLREADRIAARESADLGTLTKLIKTAKGRTDKQDRELANLAGVSPATFCTYKHDGVVANVSLITARRLAHAVGCSKEEWLRIGGFV